MIPQIESKNVYPDEYYACSPNNKTLVCPSNHMILSLFNQTN